MRNGPAVWTRLPRLRIAGRLVHVRAARNAVRFDAIAKTETATRRSRMVPVRISPHFRHAHRELLTRHPRRLCSLHGHKARVRFRPVENHSQASLILELLTKESTVTPSAFASATIVDMAGLFRAPVSICHEWPGVKPAAASSSRVLRPRFSLATFSLLPSV